MAVPRGGQERKRDALGETSSPGRSGIHSAPVFAAAGPVVDGRLRNGPMRASAPTTAQGARSEAERAEREAGQMRPCTPTRSAPSATGRQYRPRKRPKRARRQGKIGACTDPPTSVARGGPLHRSALSAFFSSTGRGAFSFCQEQKENVGRIPRGNGPLAGASLPRPPFGGPSHVTPACRCAPPDSR